MVASGLGSGRLLGQSLSVLMTLAFAGMIVLQRRRPKASMIAVNALGALGSGVFGPRSIRRIQPIGLYDFAVLFVFGLTTIGLAFVLFMEGAKLIPSAEAGLISLLDVVLGPDLGVSCLRREPGRDDHARRRDRARRRRSGAWRRTCGGEALVVRGGSMDGENFALVTGAGSGIGKASALALARAGWHVALAGRRKEPLDEVAREIGRIGRRALAAPCDVGDPEAVKALFADDRAASSAGSTSCSTTPARTRPPCRSTN